jgi:hypothetical protein
MDAMNREAFFGSVMQLEMSFLYAGVEIATENFGFWGTTAGLFMVFSPFNDYF